MMNFLGLGSQKLICWMTFVCLAKILCFSNANLFDSVVWKIDNTTNTNISVWFMYEDQGKDHLSVKIFNSTKNETRKVNFQYFDEHTWHRLDLRQELQEGEGHKSSLYTLQVNGLGKKAFKEIYNFSKIHIVAKGHIHLRETNPGIDTKWYYYSALGVLLILSMLFNCYCCFKRRAPAANVTGLPVRYKNPRHFANFAQARPSTDDEDAYEVVRDESIPALSSQRAHGAHSSGFLPNQLIPPPLPTRPSPALSSENINNDVNADVDGSTHDSQNSLYESAAN